MANKTKALQRRQGVKFGPHPIPLMARFWPKVNKNGPIPRHRPSLGRCWVWTASVAGGGYGKILGEGGQTAHLLQAHHVLWVANHGPIPTGKELDHLCRNRQCVRDSHVEPVTRRINLLRGETIIARQAAQTSCIHGHAITDENTYHHKGHRYCKTCRRKTCREFQRAYRAKN